MDGSAEVIPSIVQKSNLRRNILIAVTAVFLITLLVGTATFFLTQKKQSKESTVSLTKEYSNPFDTKTQYTNPFSGYQNPFDSLIK